MKYTNTTSTETVVLSRQASDNSDKEPVLTTQTPSPNSETTKSEETTKAEGITKVEDDVPRENIKMY